MTLISYVVGRNGSPYKYLGTLGTVSCNANGLHGPSKSSYKIWGLGTISVVLLSITLIFGVFLMALSCYMQMEFFIKFKTNKPKYYYSSKII